MCHEHRGLRIGRRRLLREAVGQRQIGRQGHHPGEFFRMTQPRVQRDRTALRETREHDLPGGNAARVFARDQLADLGL
jgi:hypothetical protein